ncbi:hypothetical protein [Pseudoduganella umbonata]|uniref:Uncharacterized protein n=1 Tax=Pseudoduganella umbonata TaxID=864828 RepID=A0A4P8HV83_9BURK|nr:hypothetical protein [Pseudoduganella umbonata]MBB3224484.1 hypothetical protein [Pseudoduganella umbonata]QCP13256.1 hypothetical protein FCL38_24615 [Pseudoduganella umbonata]
MSRDERVSQKNRKRIAGQFSQLSESFHKNSSLANGLITSSRTIISSLPSVENHTLTQHLFAARNSVRKATPSSHTLELLFRLSHKDVKKAVSYLTPNFRNLDFEIEVRTWELHSVDKSSSAFSERIDQIILSQILTIKIGTSVAGEVELIMPLFLRWQGATLDEIYVRAASTPLIKAIDDGGGLFVSGIRSRVVASVFANILSKKIDVALPMGLRSMNLQNRSIIVKDDIIRFHFTSRGARTRTDEGQAPVSDDGISIKLTDNFVDRMVREKVRIALADQDVSLSSFSIHFDRSSQKLIVILIGSTRFKKYFGNIKVSATGNAKVRQPIALLIGDGKNLLIRSVGAPSLVGEPWPSDVKAHMDTLIGGGVGVSVPDEAVEFIWNLLKRLGLRTKFALKPHTVSETISVNPFIVKSLLIREKDIILELFSSI